ncbi:MAG: glycosyltransferase family 39 protein [Verrucomicrobiota bacterium]|nr:glycosyltransferase family 39 protein [Verrucomicrobiota bacterium]
MSRFSPLVVVVAVWAAIYLPALGLFEIKGEEGRRILPAIAMLESGNYIVPQVGSGAYFRKPPLVNWLVAASFKIFGARNEWTARVPSVLCVLAVAIAFVTVARASLKRIGSTIAALIWLTNFGTMEKGRLIEIEALYISLCGLAIIFWLSWWEQKRSPWLTWLVPSLFLGLGWLSKGPTLLVFFYAVVLAVLYQSKQWRFLLHPAHFIGLAVMLGIFASWAIPFVQMTTSGQVMQKWSNQFVGRVTGEYFRFSVWILTLPRALAYFLPWLLLVPTLRLNKFRVREQRDLARAVAWSIAVPLIIINMIPGAAPRYSLPVLTPFCWLLAMSFAENAFVLPSWVRRSEKQLWARVAPIFVGLAIVAGLVGYPAASLVFKHRQKVKNIAEKINAAVPATETLYAVNPNYQPLFFYMHAPVKYVSRIEELPHDARYFLVRPHDEQTALSSQQWMPRQARFVLRVKDYRDQTLILFAVDSS